MHDTTIEMMIKFKKAYLKIFLIEKGNQHHNVLRCPCYFVHPILYVESST